MQRELFGRSFRTPDKLPFGYNAEPDFEGEEVSNSFVYRTHGIAS